MVKSFVDVNGNEEQKREEESVMYKMKLNIHTRNGVTKALERLQLKTLIIDVCDLKSRILR